MRPGRAGAPGPQFTSDNAAGIHPEVLAAIAAANTGHASAYGNDSHTQAAGKLLRAEFGAEVEVLLTFGGTGANVVGLGALLRPWEAVICAATAHIHVDECGAPERFLGCKLIPLPTDDGKLRPEQVRAALGAPTAAVDVHHVVPRVLSVSQSTELGTVYRPEELAALSALAHDQGLLLHMDGARLANAAAALQVPLRALTADVGVDVLSFGATKNGAMGAEAVIVFDAARAEAARFGQKQATQLPSKQRFLAAQFEALLRDGLWRRNAEQANRMARRLAEGVAAVPGVRIAQRVEANAVFATLPRERIAPLQARWRFLVWDEATSLVRWMCSFDTTEEEVDAFLADLRGAMR